MKMFSLLTAGTVAVSGAYAVGHNAAGEGQVDRTNLLTPVAMHTTNHREDTADAGQDQETVPALGADAAQGVTATSADMQAPRNAGGWAPGPKSGGCGMGNIVAAMGNPGRMGGPGMMPTMGGMRGMGGMPGMGGMMGGMMGMMAGMMGGMGGGPGMGGMPGMMGGPAMMGRNWAGMGGPGMMGGNMRGMPVTMADAPHIAADSASTRISEIVRLVKEVGKRADAIERRFDELQTASAQSDAQVLAQLGQ